jgi:dephospho-CoA kinase
MRLVILTGASGSGKTAIADAIRVEHVGLVEVLHFDRIGVPSPEAMDAGWGSAEAWQRAATLRWMSRIASIDRSTHAVLFEGQTRLTFLREGLLAAGITDAHLILVDCSDATRTERLVRNRNQPELANQDMMRWADLLRREATELGCEVIDTSKVPLGDCVERVSALLLAPLSR